MRTEDKYSVILTDKDHKNVSFHHRFDLQFEDQAVWVRDMTSKDWRQKPQITVYELMGLLEDQRQSTGGWSMMLGAPNTLRISNHHDTGLSVGDHSIWIRGESRPTPLDLCRLLAGMTIE